MSELALPLGEWLADSCLTDDLLRPLQLDYANAVIIPLPIHATKKRQRGFNQAELLAKPLAERLDIPLLPHAVEKRRKTEAQVGLTLRERRKNITTDLFMVKPNTVDNRTVLLLDDVFTTGTTISACAHALKRAGAAKIVAITLAAGG